MFRIFSKLKEYLLDWCLQPSIITISDLHSNDANECEIYDGKKLKFIEQKKHAQRLVKTPTGYSRIKHSHKTVKYDVYELMLENGLSLQCADEHIVMNGDAQIYVKNLQVGDIVATRRRSSISTNSSLVNWSIGFLPASKAG